jgi:hypothetical protein
VEAAGDHQMQHEPEIAFYSKGETLADSPEFADDAALDIGKWWLRGSKEKRAAQAHTLDWLPNDSRFKCSDVGDDVRKFRHAYELAGCSGVFATLLFVGQRVP